MADLPTAFARMLPESGSDHSHIYAEAHNAALNAVRPLYVEMRQQRDGLLAALEAMRKAYRRATGKTDAECIAMERADAQADEAIAAATQEVA